MVGAGPSCELGYPSWGKLADEIFKKVLEIKSDIDTETYEKYIIQKQYPELFRQAELDFGSRSELVKQISEVLTIPTSKVNPNSIYSILTKWPFSCYLTTNFDDELKRHLDNMGVSYKVMNNSPDEMSLIRADATNMIVKIHSSLRDPEHAVITSIDYDGLITKPEYNYFREKVKNLFVNFDILIIGHSFHDPDIQLLLRIAKNDISVLHPVFMILNNCTEGEKRDLREQYSIQVTSYTDSDNSHSQLKQILKSCDRFIAPRNRKVNSSFTETENQAVLAASLLIYRNLQQLKADGSGYIAPIVLSELVHQKNPLSIDQIRTLPNIVKLLKTPDIYTLLEDAIQLLTSEDLVVFKGSGYIITNTGKTRVKSVNTERIVEEDQAFGQFFLNMKNFSSKISDDIKESSVSKLKAAFVACFAERGLAMASRSMSGDQIHSDDLPDIFEAFSSASTDYSDFEIRAAFLDSAGLFLMEPNEPQKKYLANISQGFFLYHMVGLDPKCTRLRQNLFSNTHWFVDSSIFLPLLAIGCSNHKYAFDFFNRLEKLNASLFTTDLLLIEAKNHLEWAIKFIEENPINSQNFLAAATCQDDFKQNLFIDGFINLAAEGRVSKFQDYLKKVYENKEKSEFIKNVCSKFRISVLDLSECDGFEEQDIKYLEAKKDEIEKKRRGRGTYKGSGQVKAEAEILQIIDGLRSEKYKIPTFKNTSNKVYFISQSRVLDEIVENNPIITWTPEAVYRYANSISGDSINPDYLYQCMLSEYFYSGISIVDKAKYSHFFGTAISQAKISFNEQIQEYLQSTEQSSRINELNEEFDKTPDLEKPFFVSKMGWEIARVNKDKAEAVTKDANQKVKEAEKAVKIAIKVAEQAKREKDKAESELRRLRNLQDPKHLKKRRKQAKNRARKKK